jgi:hypothetical protein
MFGPSGIVICHTQAMFQTQYVIIADKFNYISTGVMLPMAHKVTSVGRDLQGDAIVSWVGSL